MTDREIPVITGDMIVEALHRAVLMRGRDFVYSPDEATGECMYRETTDDGATGRPSCIVGVAFDALGILPEDTEDYERQGVASLMDQLEFEQLAHFEVDERTRRALNRAQSEQDSCQSYGTVEDVMDGMLAGKEEWEL